MRRFHADHAGRSMLMCLARSGRSMLMCLARSGSLMLMCLACSGSPDGDLSEDVESSVDAATMLDAGTRSAAPAHSNPAAGGTSSLDPLEDGSTPDAGGVPPEPSAPPEGSAPPSNPEPPSSPEPPALAPDAYPAFAPASFQIVHRDYPNRWNSILTLSQQHSTVFITSQNRPTNVAPQRWAKNIHTSHYPSGALMADGIHALLTGPEAPARVMVDEFKTKTMAYIGELAQTMQAKYPQLAGHWGVYLWGDEFPVLNPALDQLLDAGAAIAVEFYATQTAYCANGTSSAQRDQWLADWFRGTPERGRFHWLMQRRIARNSMSHISLVLGVTDKYMNGTNPAIFLDRMFYVWKAHSGYPSILSIANGGPGSWKWDVDHEGTIGIATSGRDEAFAESVGWYAVDGKAGSRLGPVPCP